MASLSLSSPSAETVNWTISGLGSSFNQNNYIEAGVTEYMFTQASTSISGEVAWKSAPSSGSSTSVSGTFYWDPGTYTFWAYAQAKNGTYYPVGSATVTVKGAKVRPQNWYWNNMYSGMNSTNLTATEWNYFTSRINEFLSYRSLSTYSFSTAYRGDPIYAYMFNEAVNQISRMASTGVATKRTGDTIYADYFNSLSSALNSIS